MKLVTLLSAAVLASATVPSFTLLLARPWASASLSSSGASSLSSSGASSMAVTPRSITVAGDAVVNVVPDVARFALVVDAVDADRKKAGARVEASTEAVLAALRAHGIADADITTQTPTFTPQYARDRFGSPLYLQVNGWQVQQQITVCSHQLDALGGLLRAAFDAGALPDGDITFDSTRLVDLRAEARHLAAVAARKKAEALVDDLGGSLGKPRTISEYNANWSPVTYKNAVEDVDSTAVAASNFAAGKLSLSAQVSVVFDIE